MGSFHLAQLNVGRIRATLDDPIMAGFVAWLEPVNALADTSPGFVWRLQTDEGDATAIRSTDDPLLLVNLSVWESIDALADYVYRGDHVRAVRKRAEWFEPADEDIFVLWWVPAGHLPTVDEAMKRLDQLRAHGPTAEAFTFARRFEAPDEG